MNGFRLALVLEPHNYMTLKLEDQLTIRSTSTENCWRGVRFRKEGVKSLSQNNFLMTGLALSQILE